MSASYSEVILDVLMEALLIAPIESSMMLLGFSCTDIRKNRFSLKIFLFLLFVKNLFLLVTGHHSLFWICLRINRQLSSSFI
jgi:hypothetical protein